MAGRECRLCKAVVGMGGGTMVTAAMVTCEFQYNVTFNEIYGTVVFVYSYLRLIRESLAIKLDLGWTICASSNWANSAITA